MRISADGLAATRFAVSPLHQTITAVWLLGKPDPHPVGRPWLRWARGELTRRPLAAGRVWPLLTSNEMAWPEWLTPAPATRAPSLAGKLDRMLATPQGHVRESLDRVFHGTAPCPEVSRSLGVSPAAVSQHLSVLRRARLLDRTRSGHAVLYQASSLGLALLDADTDRRQAAQ
jgi:DNA-binding transcriptional ArsR family regulator